VAFITYTVIRTAASRSVKLACCPAGTFSRLRSNSHRPFHDAAQRTFLFETICFVNAHPVDHRKVTVVLDADTRRVLWVGEGRSREAVL
jgi:transketolase C-terminal domain/subunit